MYADIFYDIYIRHIREIISDKMLKIRMK